MSQETLTKKRFVIAKSLIGKNVLITFTNKKVKHILTITMQCIVQIKKSLKVWNVFRSTEITLIVTMYQHSGESTQCKNCDTCHLLYFT